MANDLLETENVMQDMALYGSRRGVVFQFKAEGTKHAPYTQLLKGLLLSWSELFE